MNSFSLKLSPTNWTEILKGHSGIAFDVKSAVRLEISFGYGDEIPRGPCSHVVDYFRSDRWDFEMLTIKNPEQRIWARGASEICGIHVSTATASDTEGPAIVDVLTRIEEELKLHRELIQGLA